MKKNILYIMCALGLLTACSSDDLPLTKSDEATFITFGASMENILTRAAVLPTGHEEWKTTDPQSMKVFGWVGEELKMKGTQVNYDNETSKWAYNPPQYWADYLTNEDYAFVACMPYNAGTTGVYTAGKYSVSMPVSMPNGFTTDKTTLPLISHLNFNPQVGEVVGFHMDQTLTAFDIQFALDAKMSKLRYFKIKSVNISGKMPVSGTVTCSFANSSTGCIQSNANVDLEWDGVVVQDDCSEHAITGTPIDVKNESFLAWGSSAESPTVFYVIPSANFNPTITVTYDVYENYDGKDVMTRQDVTSTIEFISDNFSEYTSEAAIGKINPIKIKIVPDYLYVLADDDQTQGYLVIK